MGRYIVRRLLIFVPVFFIATFVIYALVFALSGDPIRALCGERACDAALQAQLRADFNLDDPLVIQYAKYMGNLIVNQDLGTNFNGRGVSDIIGQRLPITARLAALAFVFEVVFGITAGVLAGIKRQSFVDALVSISTVAIISIPIFVFGLMNQIVVGVNLDLLPLSYSPNQPMLSLIMPAYVLAATSLAYIARLTRTSLAENLRADYVRTAKAKGLKKSRIIGVHTLRNSMIPVVTYLAIDIGSLMGGAIVTEGIFNVPGIGRAVFDAIGGQEGAVVVGIVTFLVVVYMVASLVVDVLYAVLDPRIRYE